MAVTLRLQSLANGMVAGVFEFAPKREGQGESGSFNLEGRTAGGLLTLEGGEWIQQPNGWRTIDIEVKAGEGKQRTLRGRVTSQGCGGIDVALQQ